MKTQETNTALTVLSSDQANIAITPQGQVQFKSLGDVASYAVLLAQSDLLPKGQTPKQATGNMIAGMHIGLTPWQSIQFMANVNGRPSVYGDAVIGLVLASGLLLDQKTEYFKDKDGNDTACRYTCWRKGQKEPITGEFSIKMARQAGLMEHTGWKNYPRRMLKMRARAFALRDGFADILGGVRIREEEEDTPIEVEAKVSPSPLSDTPKAKPTVGDIVSEANDRRIPDDIDVDTPPDPPKSEKSVSAEELLIV